MKVGETAAGLGSLRSWTHQSDLVAVTLLVVICFYCKPDLRYERYLIFDITM